jgi:hypothetical protein
MVEKIKSVVFSFQVEFDWLDVGIGFLLGIATVLMFASGCASTDSKAGRLILMDGQTAVILEDTTVLARIPYQGNELYAGPVTLRRGTMVMKPKVEP